MRLLSSSTFIAVLLLSLFSKPGFAQPQEGERREVRLNRAIIEYLFRVLSPQCREQLELVLESQVADSLSPECQYEIEGSMQRMSEEETMSMEGDEYLDNGFDSSLPKKTPGKPGSGGNALFWVAIFVFLFFASVALYVGYVHTVLGENSFSKAKKLSKKKLEKERMKKR